MTPEPKINSPKRFLNMEIRRSRSRGLPCGIESRLGCAFHAIKIYFPNGRGIESFDQTFIGNAISRNPGFSFASLNSRGAHATLQIAFLPWRDVQIDPKAIRADFEFLISAELRRSG